MSEQVTPPPTARRSIPPWRRRSVWVAAAAVALVAVAVGENAVWVTGPDGKLWKIAPAKGKATQHRSVGKLRPSAVAAGAGGVWVVGPGSPWVWRFSPAPFKAQERTRVGGPPFGA